MSDEHNKTADWAPGTLDKTRRNIGDIDELEAAEMTKKLGGEIMYERSSIDESSRSSGVNRSGKIVRTSASGAGSGSNGGAGGSGASGNSSASATAGAISFTPKKHSHEILPEIPKKVNNAIDRLMMSPEYKIKPNYGMFNFIRSLQKNGTERILPEFYQYRIPKAIEHMESFITVIKTMIQIAPSTYKAKIVNGSESKFKFLRMIANWSLQPIKYELMT
ncbi:MAG: hypothetical protein K6G09_10395, partial [Treponema sp.]|nr:hypothetical protein [Treponema sp.]